MSGLTEANFAVGILDLGGLDGAEKLTVTSSGLNATDALYMDSLLGQT